MVYGTIYANVARKNYQRYRLKSLSVSFIMSIVELLRANNKIVVNTDIDGVFSGLILTTVLGCEVVGFSNSQDIVWIDQSRIKSIYDCVYIDMFVPDARAGCIDQHIVCVNPGHRDYFLGLGNKLNPNLDNPRYFLPNSSYYLKYPFGTCHYIIAQLESKGLKIPIDLRNTAENLKVIDLILRADDAMGTTLASYYMDNARAWWGWLKNLSNDGAVTSSFIDYLRLVPPPNSQEKRRAIADKLQGAQFCCDSPDGGYKAIEDDRGDVKDKVKLYVRYLADSSRLRCFNLDMKLTPIRGRARRGTLSPDSLKELSSSGTVNREKVFSYAFVRTSNRPDSFSYTVI